jgi:cytochrome c oxidase subunit III
VSSPFSEPGQRREAGVLGMWVFLVTEALFFGAVVVLYGVYRWIYPEAFARASALLDWKAGAANTAVLISSGFTMALAVRDIHRDRPRRVVPLLALTALLGLTFLVVKSLEYHEKWSEGHVPWLSGGEPLTRLWLLFYFGLTGLHAVHVLVGVAALGALVLRTSIRRAATVEITGLYWHFVDVVWIFLFPLLYLLGRHR